MGDEINEKYPYLLDALEKVLAYYKENKSPEDNIPKYLKIRGS
jgi:hypothetical protein